MCSILRLQYFDIAICLKEENFDMPYSTIHQAKGKEFKNVLLILRNKKYLEFIFNMKMCDEEHRIYYVAISRAIKRLFISVPDLFNNQNIEDKLKNMFDIVRNDHI